LSERGGATFDQAVSTFGTFLTTSLQQQACLIQKNARSCSVQIEEGSAVDSVVDLLAHLQDAVGIHCRKDQERVSSEPAQKEGKNGELSADGAGSQPAGGGVAQGGAVAAAGAAAAAAGGTRRVGAEGAGRVGAGTEAGGGEGESAPTAEDGETEAEADGTDEEGTEGTDRAISEAGIDAAAATAPATATATAPATATATAPAEEEEEADGVEEEGGAEDEQDLVEQDFRSIDPKPKRKESQKKLAERAKIEKLIRSQEQAWEKVIKQQTPEDPMAAAARR
jgi:hypothetical protein